METDTPLDPVIAEALSDGDLGLLLRVLPAAIARVGCLYAAALRRELLAEYGRLHADGLAYVRWSAITEKDGKRRLASAIDADVNTDAGAVNARTEAVNARVEAVRLQHYLAALKVQASMLGARVRMLSAATSDALTGAQDVDP